MDLYQSITASVNASILKDRIEKYFLAIGYKKVEGPGLLVYKRGSYFGSLTSFLPKGWLSQVTVEIVSVDGYSSTAAVHYAVNTTGQIVTQKERDFWQDEIDHLVEAAHTGSISNGAKKISRAVARQNMLMVLLMVVVMGITTTLTLLLSKDTRNVQAGIAAGAFLSIVLFKLLFKGEQY